MCFVAMARLRDFVMPLTGRCLLPRSSECSRAKAVAAIVDHGGRLREEARRLRAADPDPYEEHQHSPDNYLKCGAEKRRIHIALSDPANDQEFDCHDYNGNGGSSSKIWDQIWQRVTDSSCRGHQSADDSTQQRF